MLKAAEKASKILIRDFGELEKLQTSRKNPKDFAKNSINRAENEIINELVKSRPDYSILSQGQSLKYHKNKKNIWIIEPVAGILNFLHGIPHFAISIALKSNNEINSGIILDPIKNELFYAEKNNGSFFNNKRIRVSKKKQIEECLFASGEILSNKLNIKMRKTGSIALDMAYLSAGRYDGFFQKNLNLCDIAAGIILIKEAGGIINFTNIEINIEGNTNIIASNSEISLELSEKLFINKIMAT